MEELKADEAKEMKEEWRKEWDERVEKFAAAVSKTTESVISMLASVVGEPSAASLEILSDEESATVEDLRSALSLVPIGVFRRNLHLLRGKPAKAEKQVVMDAQSNVNFSTDVLPSVPDDESFVAALKVGGELKIGETEVMAAMKAAIASKVGLYDLPDKLVDAMERHADELSEPCSPSFYELQRLVVSRSYGEILSALGVDSRFVSQRRQDLLLKRLNENLWNSLYGFQKQLLGWQEAWMAGAANPAALIMAITAGSSGMPPGMLQPPDTAVIRDSAEAVIDNINKVFAGTGIPVARALAWDAQRIKKVLEDDRLPSSVGAANKEQMLRMLGVEVAADYVRLERNIVKYALSIMELQKVTSGQSECVYLAAMFQLGVSIPWDKLLANKPENDEKPIRFAKREKEKEFQKF